MTRLLRAPVPPIPLSALLISPDAELASSVQRACEAVPGFSTAAVLDTYPTRDRLRSLLYGKSPNVLLLDVSRESIAAALVDIVKADMPGVQIVAINRSCNSDVLLAVMRLGVTEFLSLPVSPEVTAEAMERLRERLAANPQLESALGDLYSFLPARPGVGTTTAAVNTALFAATLTKDPLFLGDFDFACGLVRFMLKIESAYSITDGAEHISDLGEVWPKIVQRKAALEVAHAGDARIGAGISTQYVRELARFVRHKYRLAIADLSGHLEEHAIELLKASTRVFLVTTPDVVALHQARIKSVLLYDLGLADRACVLVNRTSRRSATTVDDIQSVLRLPVETSFPEDAAAATNAVLAGSAIAGGCDLGRAYNGFARSLVCPPEAPVKKRSFLEYLSIPRVYRLDHA